MKTVVFACLALALVSPAFAEEDAAAPSEMKVLEALSGDWDVAFNYRMDSSRSWMEIKSTVTNTMVLGGCAQIMEFRGDMMGPSSWREITLWRGNP